MARACAAVERSGGSAAARSSRATAGPRRCPGSRGDPRSRRTACVRRGSSLPWRSTRCRSRCCPQRTRWRSLETENPADLADTDASAGLTLGARQPRSSASTGLERASARHRHHRVARRRARRDDSAARCRWLAADRSLAVLEGVEVRIFCEAGLPFAHGSLADAQPSTDLRGAHALASKQHDLHPHDEKAGSDFGLAVLGAAFCPVNTSDAAAQPVA